MQTNIFTCTKYVGDKIVCRYCKENCNKLNMARFHVSSGTGVAVVKELSLKVILTMPVSMTQ